MDYFALLGGLHPRHLVSRGATGHLQPKRVFPMWSYCLFLWVKVPSNDLQFFRTILFAPNKSFSEVAVTKFERLAVATNIFVLRSAPHKNGFLLFDDVLRFVFGQI